MEAISTVLWMLITIILLAFGLSLLSLVLPFKAGQARRMMALLRPVLVIGIIVISGMSYHVFWMSMVPYWQWSPFSPTWVAHVTLATWLQLNVLWNRVVP